MSLRGQILDLLTRHRFTLADEKLCQKEMAEAFTAAGLDFRREVHLGEGDIIDFIVGTVGTVGIEVKIKGARRAIFRQIERYCEYEAICEIVLATNVPMNLPCEINGKPTAIAAIGRGWL